MVLISIVTGANLNQLITGGPHIVRSIGILFFWKDQARGKVVQTHCSDKLANWQTPL